MRIFTGDYSPGDFRQWEYVMCTHVPEGVPAHSYSSGRNFPPRRFYSAQVISEDKDAGYVARHELRQHDSPWWGGGARSEVSAPTDTFAPIGSTRWYAFSVKFDPTFPTNHWDLNWGVVQQFHDKTVEGTPIYSPVVTFGWPDQTSVSLTQPGAGFRSGYWYLYHAIYPAPSGPGVKPHATHLIPVFEFPFNLGQWHDIKLQIKWEQDSTGFIRLWWNGERQTLYGGTDTATGPTVPPSIGATPEQTVIGQTVQLGYYRYEEIVPPGIVYHAGFRMADTEDSL